MISLVKENLDKIIETCKMMQLKSYYLFGPASDEKKFTKRSDLDFLYKFKKDKNGYTVSNFDLLFSLEKNCWKKNYLVAKDKIKNKFFLERVNNEKIKIYES